jgi:hypothetical protein
MRSFTCKVSTKTNQIIENYNNNNNKNRLIAKDTEIGSESEKKNSYLVIAGDRECRLWGKNFHEIAKENHIFDDILPRKK